MPTHRQFIAIALLAAAAVVAHAEDASKKDPKTGKNCVTFLSFEAPDDRGRVKVNFRNTCASSFQIQMQVDGKVRENRIEAGSPEKPSRAFITCKSDERCEAAKWDY
jgi:hypothetical protein